MCKYLFIKYLHIFFVLVYERQILLNDSRLVEAVEGHLAAFLAHDLAGFGGEGEHILHGLGEGLAILGRHHEAILFVLDGLATAGRIGSDDGARHRKGFEHDTRQAFAVRRQNDDVGIGYEFGDVVGGAEVLYNILILL